MGAAAAFGPLASAPDCAAACADDDDGADVEDADGPPDVALLGGVAPTLVSSDGRHEAATHDTPHTSATTRGALRIDRDPKLLSELQVRLADAEEDELLHAILPLHARPLLRRTHDLCRDLEVVG